MVASDFVKTGKTITVAALIAELQKYPPDTPVVVGCDDVSWTCPGSRFSPADDPETCDWGGDFDDAVVTIIGSKYISF